jgi:hypothetical protein
VTIYTVLFNIRAVQFIRRLGSYVSYESVNKQRLFPITALDSWRRNLDTGSLLLGSRDSSVGIATGYGLDGQRGGSSSPGRVKHFHFSISSIPALGSTEPPIKLVLGALYRGREADHSPPNSAEVKKCGSIHPLPHTPSWRNVYS